LPFLVGEAACRLLSNQRLHVDCEYNRFGDDTKWFPWEHPVVGRESAVVYYTPVPDIILHRRGAEGPNVLVIEAKKQGSVDEFTALIGRLKLIGYLGPSMNYAYGLYLSLGDAQGRVVVATAELVEYATVREAKDGRGNAAWNSSRQLVQSRVESNGRVFLCREPDAPMQAQAGKLNDELIRSFSFTSVKDQIAG
jgi:hypothetical protein